MQFFILRMNIPLKTVQNKPFIMLAFITDFKRSQATNNRTMKTIKRSVN